MVAGRTKRLHNRFIVRASPRFAHDSVMEPPPQQLGPSMYDCFIWRSGAGSSLFIRAFQQMASYGDPYQRSMRPPDQVWSLWFPPIDLLKNPLFSLVAPDFLSTELPSQGFFLPKLKEYTPNSRFESNFLEWGDAWINSIDKGEKVTLKKSFFIFFAPTFYKPSNGGILFIHSGKHGKAAILTIHQANLEQWLRHIPGVACLKLWTFVGADFQIYVFLNHQRTLSILLFFQNDEAFHKNICICFVAILPSFWNQRAYSVF